MRTSHPIATISYNSKAFLKAKLDELMRNYTIEFYFFIYHIAEKDEGSNHFHVWIAPNKMIDTMKLKEMFIEPDLSKPDKPLGCINFESSKESDAVLYFIHDPTYLQYKHQSREMHYTFADVVTPDDRTFERMKYKAMYESEFAEWKRRQEVLNEGLKRPADMILSGQIPLQQAGSLLALKKMTIYGLNRDGRKTHTPKDIKNVDIRGICDDAYCPECKQALSEEFIDKDCPYCGCSLNWEIYKSVNDL